MKKVTAQVAPWALDLPPKLRQAIGPTDERPWQSIENVEGSNSTIVGAAFRLEPGEVLIVRLTYNF